MPSSSANSELPEPPALGQRPSWFAVATRSRHEQSVARFLERHSVETYVPLKRTWSTRVDRRKQIDVPALPGYMFIRCHLSPDSRAAVKKAPGGVCLVAVSDRPCRIPDSQIESLRILLQSHQHVSVSSEWTEGQPVRIRTGPIKGATGTLVRVKQDQHRLVVRIEHIGLALSVDVHEADVEPIKGS
jgi:transcription termination/antitermination protein NusG